MYSFISAESKKTISPIFYFGGLLDQFYESHLQKRVVEAERRSALTFRQNAIWTGTDNVAIDFLL
jgi:hypothetical protein